MVISVPQPYFVDALAQVSLFQLKTPADFAHSNFGDRWGKQRGASIDFQDHRTYFPGDDIRFIDWSATARSEQIVLKTFHEEISPNIEICLDASLSMSVSQEKWNRCIQLISFFAHLAKSDHFKLKVYYFGDRIKPLLQLHQEYLAQLVTENGLGLENVIKTGLPLQGNAIRFVISDFMIGENIKTVIHQLFHNCSSGIAIRILDEFEINPSPLGGRRLIDVENNEEISLRITDEMCAKYKQRFEVHTDKIYQALRKYKSILFTTSSEKPLKDILVEMTSQNIALDYRK